MARGRDEAAGWDGYSGVCVADGLVYCCGLKGKDGVARAFDLDGKPVWEAIYGPDIARNSTLMVADGLLFYKSMVNTLFALDAKTGETVWTTSLTLSASLTGWRAPGLPRPW